jgi:hypothetical protein
MLLRKCVSLSKDSGEHDLPDLVLFIAVKSHVGKDVFLGTECS